MEIKIKSMKYEDFKDNESLEELVKEINKDGKANIFVGVADDVINWGRSNSLWPLTFATSCCGIEFMAVGAARYDFARSSPPRYGAFRLRGRPCQPASGGYDGGGRNDRAENGPGISPSVRPAGQP